MDQVEHFLRQAMAARELARNASTDTARTQFEMIAALWEELAEDRKSLLDLNSQRQHPDA
jgi:hypothetical protein